MCFAIPSKIIELDRDNEFARIDTMGVEREISTHLILEPLAVGDYVLLQAGMAMEKISEAQALESLALYHEISAMMAVEDEQH